MTSPTRRIRLHAETTEDGKGLARLRDDLQKAAAGADSLGGSMADMEGDARSLDVQIARTKKEIRDLGEEFEATGDTSLFGDLRKQRSHLRQLELISKDAGQGAGQSFTKAFSGGLDLGGSGIRPMHAAIGGLVAFVAAALPTIGAMVSAAVVGAGGLGGIAGGIFAAARSPAVGRAASQFASNVSSAFFQMGDEFVEPLVESLGILEQGFHNLGLEEMFENLAPYVNDLAIGLAGFGEKFMDRFTSAMAAAGPTLEAFSRQLPNVGDALGYMFERMAQGKGTVEGMNALMGLLASTLRGLGNIMAGLGSAFADMNQAGANIAGWLEDIPDDALPGWLSLGETFGEVNDRTEQFIEDGNIARQVLNGMGHEYSTTAADAQKTADAVNKLNDGLLEQRTAALALSNAHLAYQSDLLRLNEGVKEHGTSLKESTAAGIANRQMINQLIGGLQEEYDQAIIAAEGNEEKEDRAREAYNRQVQDLQKVLINLGFEKAAIAEIIGQYKNIPRRITTEFIQQFTTRGVPLGEHSGIRAAEGRAAGGPVLEGVPYTINERGSETVTFPANGMVHPASLTPMAPTMSARPFRPVITDPLMEMAFNAFVKIIGDRGGTLAVIGIRN